MHLHDIMGRGAGARRRADTLAGRLALALALFVCAATIIIAAAEYVRLRREHLRSAVVALDSRTRLVADRLERAVLERRRLVAVWPGLESSRDLALDDVDKRLARSLVQLAGDFGGGATAVAADPRGRIVAASRRELIGLTLADPAWLAVAAPRTTLSASPGAGRILVVAAPVSARGGALLGSIALATPWAELLAAAAGDALPALRVSDTLGVTLAAGPVASGGGALVRGRPRRVALGGPTVEMTLAQPRAAALAALPDAFRPVLVLALAILLVSLPAAVIVARSTTGALRRLQAAAIRLRADEQPDFGALAAGAPLEVRVLAGALEDMVRRLEASRDEIARQQSLATMGTMAAVLAHEIRTPLAVLSGAADVLGRRGAADPETTELVAFVREEIARLARLAEDLLVFARPRPPEAVAADLADTAARALSTVAGRAAAEGIALETRLSPAPVVADPDQLFQAVLNLLQNALDVSHGGGAVEIETGTRGGEAYLAVIDHGPGIAAENVERIWLPFFTTRRGGTGLGLPIVRRIAEAHGGRVAIDSVPGEGARLTVTLARREDA